MTAVLCTNHSWPFEKAYTTIYLTFDMFSSRIDALSHTFAYGRLQCLSESRGGLMRPNLFLEFVRDAIVVSLESSSPHPSEFQTDRSTRNIQLKVYCVYSSIIPNSRVKKRDDNNTKGKKYLQVRPRDM